MAKVELSGNDIRVILDSNPELFEEVRRKLLRSALKNSCAVQLSAEVKEFLHDCSKEALLEAGIEFKRVGYQDRYTVFSKALQRIVGNFSDYTEAKISEGVYKVKCDLDNKIEAECYKLLNSGKVQSKLEEWVKIEISRTVDRKVSALLQVGSLGSDEATK